MSTVYVISILQSVSMNGDQLTLGVAPVLGSYSSYTTVVENTKASQSKQSARSFDRKKNLTGHLCDNTVKNEKLGVMWEKNQTLVWINTLFKNQQNEVQGRKTSQMDLGNNFVQ